MEFWIFIHKIIIRIVNYQKLALLDMLFTFKWKYNSLGFTKYLIQVIIYLILTILINIVLIGDSLHSLLKVDSLVIFLCDFKFIIIHHQETLLI